MFLTYEQCSVPAVFLTYEQWLSTWQDILEEYPCHVCNGGTEKFMEECSHCDGTGVVECSECGADKKCTHCNDGKVEADCEDCNGKGVVTYSWQYRQAQKEDGIRWQKYVNDNYILQRDSILTHLKK